jgi:glucose uptake protein GlcU
MSIDFLVDFCLNMWYNVGYKAYRNGRRLILPLEMGVFVMMEWNDFFQFIIATSSVLNLVVSVIALIVAYKNNKKK